MSPVQAADRPPSPNTSAAAPASTAPLGPAGDVLLNAWGDQAGYHLAVARGGSGYNWHEVALLRPAGISDDSWTGYQCTSGDGKFAAVTVLPAGAVNQAEARDHGAFAYSVSLTDGTVKPLAAGVALKYHSPGCGTADLATFTSNPGTGQQSTQLLTADLAAGTVLRTTTVDAQVTSVVPTADGPVGVIGANLVQIPDSGEPKQLAAVKGSAFDLRPLADGALGLVTVRPGDPRATVLKEHGGKLTEVGSGPRDAVQLLPGRAGKPVAVGTDKLDGKAGLVAAGTHGLPLGVGAVSLDGGAVLGPGPQTDAATPLVVATAGSTPLQRGKADNSATASTVLPNTTVGTDPLAGPAKPGQSPPGASPDPARPQAAAPDLTAANTTTPKCAVPRLTENRQVMQPSAAQVEWAIQMAEQGLLTGTQYTRPANFANLGLVAYAPNGDFPRIPLQHPAGDTWDSVPRSVYQAIVAQESNFSQASWHSLPGVPGDPQIADYYGAGGTVTQLDYSKADCGYGLGQVTAGMSAGDGTYSVHGQWKIAVDYQENVAAGLQILENTWNKLYSMGALVNGGDPRYLENWYLAAWAYNSGIQPTAAYGNTTNCTPSATCTGPDGTWGLGWGNNPMNPDYPPNRTPYLSTTYDDARHPGSWPYEERIMGWIGSPILRSTGTAFAPAYAKPTYHGGKSWLQIPAISTFCTADDKCDPSYVNSSNPSISYCTLADRECWWHSSAGWVPDCTTTCTTSDYSWSSGSTEPSQSNPHPPTCNLDTSKVPTSSNGAPIIVDESQSYPPLNLVGCANPNWSQGGTFGYSFGTNSAGAPLGAIDTHQLGVGFGGHILFTHTVDGSDPSQVDTGTWTPNLPSLQYYKIKLHLPATGATATNVVYTINPGGGVSPWKIRVNQDWGSEQWVTIGTFAMQNGGNVQLTNKSDVPATGNVNYANYDVAFDAIAFLPMGGTPGKPIGGPPTIQDAPKGSNPAFIQCGCARRTAGDPVDTSTGYFGDQFTDLSTPGRGLPLDFTRSYASALADPNGPNGSLAVNGPFGWGWTYSYNLSTSTDSSTGNVTVRQEDGSQVTFVNSSGSYAPSAPRFDATLVKNGPSYTYTRRSKEIYTFDAATGRLTAETDLAGSKANPPYATTLAYDGSGHLATITDPAGHVYTLTWSSSHITGLSDSAGRQVTYGYDANGNLTDVYGVGTTRTPVLQDDDHAQYGYTAAHLMSSIRTPAQYGSTATPTPVVSMTYDASERVLTQTDQVGGVTGFTYGPDSTDNLTAGQTLITDPAGHKKLDTYQNGLLVTETKGYSTADAGTWSYSYDPVTLGVIGITDPNGAVQTFSYDDHGNQIAASDQRGYSTSSAYNGTDDLIVTTDPDGLQTTYNHDESGHTAVSGADQLTSITQQSADGLTTPRTRSVYYDDPAHPADATRSVDARGNTTGTTYDSAGEVVTSTDPLGHVTKNGYDQGRGLLTSTVTPTGTAAGTVPGCTPPAKGCTTYRYDAWGNRTGTTDPLGHSVTSAYDADGNKTSETDANGRTTTYTFDPADRNTVTTQADNTQLATNYDPDGTIARTVDAAGHATGYGYDGQGRQISRTDPDNHTTTSTYDSAGNHKTTTDPSGRRTTFGYDPANHQTSATYSDTATTAVTMSYDAAGRQVGMTDASGASTWNYDVFGELLTHTNGSGAATGYGYDPNGNRTSITYPGVAGQTVIQSFDAADNLASVTDSSSRKTVFGYTPDGQWSSTTYPNGTSTTTTFDDTDQPAGDTLSKGASTLAALTYTRDNTGRLSSQTPTGLADVAQTYQYTARNQLSTVRTATATIGYSYDQAGNPGQLGKVTQAFDPGGELCWSTGGAAPGSPSCAQPPSGATTFGYDSQGNRTARTTGTAVSTFGYDQAGHLTSVKTPSASATYQYDGSGLRTSKTVGGATDSFTWDSGSVPRLLTDSTTTYLYGPGGLPIEQITAGGTQWFFHDQLGSTRALTDATGAVVAGYGYDSYGTVTSQTGTATTALQYSGQYRDAETGLIYLRARFYDPTTAQFLTVDPAVQLTLSPYLYASDDPLNLTDPSGLFGWGSIVNFVHQHADLIGQINSVATAVAVTAAVVAGACGAVGALPCAAVAGVVATVATVVVVGTQALTTVDQCSTGSGWGCASSALYLGADLVGAKGTSKLTQAVIQSSRKVGVDTTLDVWKKICSR
ncbi:RHS repeat-associated core domain-containing protein [Kitasatospora sp. NPDC006697]|uniref:RHS repeat-associated core domain-containing protein n=1 Tax=Kitasatospora sp. NPDC006697 TaxID=3364020 RepID=UPI0036BAC253